MSWSWGHSDLSHPLELLCKITQEFSHGASCSSFLLLLRTKRQNFPRGREKMDFTHSSAWLDEVCASATTSGLHPRGDQGRQSGKWEFWILSRQLQPGFVHSDEENQGMKWIPKSCTLQDQLNANSLFLSSQFESQQSHTGQEHTPWPGGMEPVPPMSIWLQISPQISPFVCLISLKLIPPSRV